MKRLSPGTTAIEPRSPGASAIKALALWSLCSATREATAMRSLHTALPTAREEPRQQRRGNISKNKQIKFKINEYQKPLIKKTK